MKRLSNENSVGEVLKQIITTHKLESGMNQVAVAEAWKSLMGKGVNTYTKQVMLKGSVLYVDLTSAVLREELSYGKDKIIRMINDELGQEVVTQVVLR